jgi:tRNA (mo5U34)-methyltransferase
MATRSRTFRWRGLGVRVEVPEGFAARLRGRGTAKKSRGRLPDVEFMLPKPALRLRGRDAVHALDLFRVPPGHEPPSWTPRLRSIPPGTEALAARVSEIVWYHSIELPGGLTTPGVWDHRPLVPHYGFPADMTGMTAIDVATFDGFWAFEMERRGAKVVALDIDTMSQADFPVAAREQIREEGVDVVLGRGFDLAREVLGSSVEKIKSTVYELAPERTGTFDYVHMGDLLVHLERPLEALRRVRSVTKRRAHIVDVFYPELSDPERQLLQYEGGWDGLIWWRPSLETLAQLVLDAGFRSVGLHTVYRIPLEFSADVQPWRAVLIAEV